MTFSFHFLSSPRFSIASAANVSSTLAIASSLLKPSPAPSSYAGFAFVAALGAALVSSLALEAAALGGAGFLGADTTVSSFISSSSFGFLAAKRAVGFLGPEDEGGGPQKASSPNASKLYAPLGRGFYSGSPSDMGTSACLEDPMGISSMLTSLAGLIGTSSVIGSDV
jgi:hypothetical protein